MNKYFAEFSELFGWFLVVAVVLYWLQPTQN